MEAFDKVSLGLTVLGRRRGHVIVPFTEQVFHNEPVQEEACDDLPSKWKALEGMGVALDAVVVGIMCGSCEK